MIGIDTNVVVRPVVADDADQTRCARELIDKALGRDEPVLVSLLVLLEARELSFEDEPALEEALFHWTDSACGFSDCLIAAHNRPMECRSTATFDGKAARLPGTMAL